MVSGNGFRKRIFQSVDQEEPMEDKRSNEKTVFVGNLPSSTTKKELKRYFRDCGAIESVRIRSFKKHNYRRRTNSRDATIDSHLNAESIFGYLQFNSPDSVKLAVEKNGSIFQENIIRVDPCINNGILDPKKTIFIGNVCRTATENVIYKYFDDSKVGVIDTIRLIRDPNSGISKGFGFVMFKEKEAVDSALKLAGRNLCDRPIRIFRASPGQMRKKEKHMKESQKQSPWMGKKSKKVDSIRNLPSKLRQIFRK